MSMFTEQEVAVLMKHQTYVSNLMEQFLVSLKEGKEKEFIVPRNMVKSLREQLSYYVHEYDRGKYYNFYKLGIRQAQNLM